ncbi:hypothetical protein FHE66_14575 [Georgenia sp. 311]|uniref:hypothetical protein n=1 Tax=Georgenia sp. 311 TaxID=2585134 RepID=UPI001111FCB3|nr:hypothetical protein [Georgenia sp. 311]TNC16600.1 hypothetical protein FHE66_14575 [Georgenia sp. 311]
MDLALGTVEPRDDGSESAHLWHTQHHLTEGHLGIPGGNPGLRLTVYDDAGGFPDLDDGEDVRHTHAVRDVADLPWTSPDRPRVLTSSRRQGRAGRGFAGFRRPLDDAVTTFDTTDELQDRLLATCSASPVSGPDRTLCPRRPRAPSPPSGAASSRPWPGRSRAPSPTMDCSS